MPPSTARRSSVDSRPSASARGPRRRGAAVATAGAAVTTITCSAPAATASEMPHPPASAASVSRCISPAKIPPRGKATRRTGARAGRKQPGDRGVEQQRVVARRAQVHRAGDSVEAGPRPAAARVGERRAVRVVQQRRRARCRRYRGRPCAGSARGSRAAPGSRPASADVLASDLRLRRCGNEEMADPRAISHSPFPSRTSPTRASRIASNASGMRRRSRSARRRRARKASAHSDEDGQRERDQVRRAEGTGHATRWPRSARAVRPGIARSARATGGRAGRPGARGRRAAGRRRTSTRAAGARSAAPARRR